MPKRYVDVTLRVAYDEDTEGHPSAWPWDELMDPADENDLTLVKWEDVDA